MRRVRMRKLLARPDGIYGPGREIDLQDREAQRMVVAGDAEWVDRPVQVRETAALDHGETATQPRARPRRRR